MAQYRLPDLGEGIHEAEVVRWLVASGDHVRRDQPLVEVMTDKAVVELPSGFTGHVTHFRAAEGDTVQAGEPLLEYSETDDSNSASDRASDRAVEQPQEQSSMEAAPPKDDAAIVRHSDNAAVAATRLPPKRNSPAIAGNGRQRVQGPPPAAPAVRHMARSLDLDLRDIRGSGPDGRVLVEDLADHVREAMPQPADHAPRTPARIPLRGVRRKTAERMVHSKRTIPHYAYVDECDVTQLVKLRAALGDAWADQGPRLTYLPFFVQAACHALRQVPLVNSSLDDQNGEIVLQGDRHIGVAMATARGLLVPVLRDADQMDLRQIAAELQRLADAARSDKLRPEELRGGTFTITSVGGIGGLISTPIINHPQVAIMGVGRIAKRPICDEDGAIRAADMVYLSFSFDHRVIDGAVAAEFGNAVKQHLTEAGLDLAPPRRPK